MTEQVKSLAIDNPVVNSPYAEPRRYWTYEEGQPVLKEGRRPAGVYLKARTREAQLALLEEEFVPLEAVNTIRQRVKEWRERGYPGITPITRRLLQHWRDPERERKLFFCQIEAAETLIWLVEAPAAEKQGINIPKDNGLRRYACKMATGSGKTVVMAMVIAWQVLNKLANPRDGRFSDAVLVVCPNLTIKERLRVLLPHHRKNFYEAFDLVPPGMTERLAQGRYQVTNWHLFLPRDDSRSKSVVQRGVEGDAAFCRRVLKELGNKSNILVINDEAHHAYRPAPRSAAEGQPTPEEEEARVWVAGLDRIHRAKGINFCADFSATPFFIKGSGYDEGEPFPWIVSDFGLADAIECGIVKVPRVPVASNTGAPIPEYFRLWEYINSKLPPSERQTARRRAKPESVLREAEPALATLASEWERTFQEFRQAGSPVPPVLIVVCDNTDLAKLVHEHIAQGKVMGELANSEGAEVTVRIDTRLLEEAEAALEGETKEAAAEKLRKKVATVGKTEWEGEGEPPGKDVRCVVSVSMLNEGWDAPNVTQILGLRAFTSQLLCEQVVGRGLRRTSYDVNPETGLLEPEYVDVYGVPFEVIPVKKKKSDGGDRQKVSILVRALPERADLEITFPRVEGYVFDVRQRIRLHLQGVPYLIVSPNEEPTEVTVKPAVGYRVGRPDRLGPGLEEVHDRNPFYTEKRLQSTVYELAAELTERLCQKRREWQARHILFPQVLRCVWEYLEQRVEFKGDVPREEVALLKYRQRIVERLSEAIEPDVEAAEPPILPVLERFRPIGSTKDVLFRTSRDCVGTTKSHVSHVVLDASNWESSAAYHLERMDEIIAYVKNDGLGFAIPYEWQGQRHEYRPDYLIRLRCPGCPGGELKVILEVKGRETEQDRQKYAAAQRWVKAVNYKGDLGRWAFLVCRNPTEIEKQLRSLCKP
ncbi:MAG: DEAD/DEAH box helicase family protein [Chloroflexota bacterium]|nr:DEAD/DEAH box helicase family protein [Chloroflexota bacterium]